jgi:hypothetical protein
VAKTFGDERPLGRRFRLPIVLSGIGGLGLVVCVACCSLPLLGAIGLGGGVAAVAGIVEPLSAALLTLGAIAAVVTFARLLRKNQCGPAEEGTSCSTDESCGCGPNIESIAGSARR